MMLKPFPTALAGWNPLLLAVKDSFVTLEPHALAPPFLDSLQNRAYILGVSPACVAS